MAAMKIGVMGTGMVGQAIASRLVDLGHEVVMGGREATNPKAVGWAADRLRGRAGTFADAAAHAELVVNATAGVASLAVLSSAGGGAILDGKVLIDVANPLDFSNGMPPRLSVANTDSLGEQIQRAYPAVRVVKTLNTVNANIMVEPRLLPGPHAMFIAGDDAGAKELATGLLREFGWPPESIIDLGGIQAARGMEMYLPLWLSIMGAQRTVNFNINVVR
jgi:hypothetical protein